MKTFGEVWTTSNAPTFGRVGEEFRFCLSLVNMHITPNKTQMTLKLKNKYNMLNVL